MRVEEHPCRRRTVVREGHRHSTVVDEAHARKVLACRRERVVAEVTLDCAEARGAVVESAGASGVGGQHGRAAVWQLGLAGEERRALDNEGRGEPAVGAGLFDCALPLVFDWYRPPGGAAGARVATSEVGVNAERGDAGQRRDDRFGPAGPRSVAQSVTHVPGLFCYPCPRTVPQGTLSLSYNTYTRFGDHQITRASALVARQGRSYDSKLPARQVRCGLVAGCPPLLGTRPPTVRHACRDCTPAKASPNLPGHGH